MVRLILVRHGFSLSNKDRRFTGQADIPLDEVGFLQAERVGEYLFSNFQIDAIYSSDLSRTVDTAAPTARLFGLPIQKRKDLREVDVGRWGGHYFDSIKDEFPEDYALYKKDFSTFTYPGGESCGDVRKRAEEAIAEIAKENDGKTVMIVSHGGVLRVLRCVWTGHGLEDLQDMPRLLNASITVADYEDGKACFHEINYTEHLDVTTDSGTVD